LAVQKIAQMTFKLNSENVSIISEMRIKKHFVILYSQLWSEAGFHHEGHEEHEEN